jgi:hypothetical protein
MTDLSPIAAVLLANFATVRIPRCDRLRWRPDSDPSLRRDIESVSATLVGERFVAGCHRGQLRQRLLDDGHRAFFDRVEGGGPDGWRLHFFCYDPATVLLLHDIQVGTCGPGDPVAFDAEKFVMHHLHRLERSGQLASPDKWWDSVDE